MPPPLNEDLDRWTRRLAPLAPPVLASTRDAIESLRGRRDRADANLLADIVLRDPLMTLRVLVVVAARLGKRLATPVTTVTGALVLLGIEPFFAAFESLETIEDRLASRPEALESAMQALERSRRAARLAAAFAVHRQDDQAEVLHQAALLDHFSTLLLWGDVPELMQDIAARQQADSQLRSADAQRRVLGTEIIALDHALMQAWDLAAVLRAQAPGAMRAAPGVTGVALAVRIARHLEQGGWDSPALPDDFAELGQLLVLTPHAAKALVMEVEGEKSFSG